MKEADINVWGVSTVVVVGVVVAAAAAVDVLAAESCVVVKLVGNRVVGVSELVTDADGSSFPHEMK